MPKTLTATYESEDAAENAHDDLIASGYPREKLFLEQDAPELKVMTPDETAPEAREILGRHQPSEISEREI